MLQDEEYAQRLSTLAIECTHPNQHLSTISMEGTKTSPSINSNKPRPAPRKRAPVKTAGDAITAKPVVPVRTESLHFDSPNTQGQRPSKSISFGASSTDLAPRRPPRSTADCFPSHDHDRIRTHTSHHPHPHGTHMPARRHEPTHHSPHSSRAGPYAGPHAARTSSTLPRARTARDGDADTVGAHTLDPRVQKVSLVGPQRPPPAPRDFADHADHTHQAHHTQASRPIAAHAMPRDNTAVHGRGIAPSINDGHPRSRITGQQRAPSAPLLVPFQPQHHAHDGARRHPSGVEQNQAKTLKPTSNSKPGTRTRDPSTFISEGGVIQEGWMLDSGDENQEDQYGKTQAFSNQHPSSKGHFLPTRPW